MPDTVTWNFQCGCHCFGHIFINVQAGDHAHQIEQVRKELLARNWVIGKDDVDKDGKVSFFAYCSLKCHNDYVQHLFERNNAEHWWNMYGEKDGPGQKPKCTCMLETLTDGRFVECRHPSCPWHTWLNERRVRRNAEARALYDQWKDVPVGTPVFESDNVNKGRGHGCTTGPAKIIEYSFGGAISAVIPWDQNGIHPLLRDLKRPVRIP